MTGEQFLQKLNQLITLTKNPPKIILSTGLTGEDNENKINKLPVNNVLHKPFRSLELLQLVRKTLDL